MESAERILLFGKLDELRTAAQADHPDSTRGIVDALCVVAELLVRVIERLDALRGDQPRAMQILPPSKRRPR